MRFLPHLLNGRVENTDPRSADYPLTPTPRTTLWTTPRTTLRTTLNNQPNLLLPTCASYAIVNTEPPSCFCPFPQPSPSYCNLTLRPVLLDPPPRRLLGELYSKIATSKIGSVSCRGSLLRSRFSWRHTTLSPPLKTAT